MRKQASIFTCADIFKHYERSKRIALAELAAMPIALGKGANIPAVHGWLFERTIAWALRRELRALGMAPVIQFQVSLAGRAKVDLLIGRAAIEVKLAGSFGSADSKYLKYRGLANARHWDYIYVSRPERVQSYRHRIQQIFGTRNTFYLDTDRDWARLVETVRRACSLE